VGDFFGEESMSAEATTRGSTASAISACVATKIAKLEMLRVLHEEHTFSDFFMQFILMRGIRTQADLVDQLFNSSERRLARTLLIMAEYGKPGEPVALIPPVTQETLAEIIGSTRSRVSFFMNRFRKLGYIEYSGYVTHIRVHTSLLNAILRDELPEENSSRPRLLDPPASRARTAKRKMLV
jgi:CRP-like cAMP-binding protein